MDFREFFSGSPITAPPTRPETAMERIAALEAQVGLLSASVATPLEMHMELVRTLVFAATGPKPGDPPATVN